MALSAIRHVYNADYAPRRGNAPRRVVRVVRQHGDAGSAAGPAKSLMKSSSLSSFMKGARARVEAPSTSAVVPAEELDELEMYLASPDEDMDVDVQEWWASNASKFPTVAKMARQWLSSPATSAEVERVFTKAGKMNDDHKKRTSEDLLCENLFVGANSKIRRLRY